MTLEVKIYGLRELEQNLRMLKEEVRERGVKRMMSRAAVPMRDDAKRRAPFLKQPDPTGRRIPGTIRKHIAIWRKRDTPYAATYYVGIRGLSRKAISAFKQRFGKTGASNWDDPFYWRFLEFGTSKMRAQPFLRPAFESKKMESARLALEEGRKFIRALARKFKKTKRTGGTHVMPAGSWKAFVGARMGEYMRSEGGHAGAMKRIAQEWAEHKKTL